MSDTTIQVMDLENFVRCEAEGLVFYQCVALQQLQGIHHGFSTRHGGTGALNLTHLPWDSHSRVEENRRRFLTALGLAHARLATLSQIHSDRLVIFKDPAWDLNHRREGDALATQLAGLALGVQVADCFPVLLADEKTGAIAAVHSGWRGAAARILGKTIAAMLEVYGADPRTLLVAIGPGIRSCCMQIGPEVAARFEEAYPGMEIVRAESDKEGKYLLDIPQALAIQCEEKGLKPERKFELQACTRCHPEEYFSYRAEGAAAGRMMAAIGRSRQVQRHIMV